MKKQNKNRGYSIIEILVYLAIFTALSIVVINSFMVILFSFNTTNMNRALLESGTIAMERMSREIRQAESIEIGESSFVISPGVLQLKSTDIENGDPAIVRFETVNQALHLYKDDNDMGNLLDQNISITNLIFRRISSTNSEAVKIEMTLLYDRGQMTKSANFYNTIVLRGGY